MAARQLVYVLFLLVAVGLGVLRPRETHSAAPEQQPGVPQEAVRALREGRYLRASLILREYLGGSADSSAAAILMSAQAEAGLGDWDRVRTLLRGRPWLDTLAAGHGWELLGRSQLELGRWEESRASYARYLAVADTGADRAQGLALVRRAIAQMGADAPDSALVNYRRAQQHLPQIGDWLHVHAARAAAAAGDTAAVEQELIAAAPELREAWGWRARLEARERAGLTRSALAVAEAAAAADLGASAVADARARAGKLRLDLSDTAGARVAFLGAMSAAPASAHAVTAARALADLRTVTAGDHRRIGDVYLRHGNVDRALSSYQVFLSRGAPASAERLELQYAIGRALFNAGRYDAAESRLIAFADSTPDVSRAAAARYLAARAQYRDGRKSEALASLRGVVNKYPTESAGAEAAFLLADLAHDASDEEQARQYYRQATVLAPSSDEAGHARMRLAGMSYVSGDYTTALQHYDAYLAAFPQGRRAQHAAYWSGRARLALGQKTQAVKLLRQVRAMNPFSYYSVRAADLLDENFWNVPLEPSPAISQQHESQVAYALARIELLREIGWEEAATFELGRARRHFAQWDGALYSLAEGLNQRGYTSAGVSLGWELQRREGGWNVRLLRIVYPFPYRPIILAEAAERKVDPFLAAGLIRQESMFNPRARSGAGALGLMQVMPATGAALAKSAGIRNFKPEMLRQPDVNVHLGMRFLADQLRTWNGRVVPVLAAYNAGPARVQRWRSFPEWGRDELFAERIPYDETRDYVKIVQYNAAMYRALYGSVVGEVVGD